MAGWNGRAMPGICAWFGVRVPFVDRMRLIRAAGFEATALWWEEDRPEARRLRHRAPDIVRDAGLYLDNFHAPYRGCNRLWSDNESDRAEAVTEHAGWLADCARHGVPVLVMHVTLGNSLPPPTDAGIDSLRRIVDAAEDRGVTVAVENTRSVPHLDAVLEAIDSPCLGLCYDSSHDHLYSDCPGALLDRRGHRLTTTHWSDTDGRRDRHWLPGEGVLEFEALNERVPTAYSGVHLLEVVAQDKNESPEPFLARAFEALTKLSMP